VGRRLRSKRLRAALYAAAGGRCTRCGAELTAGWHADHVVPWSVRQRTNVHEMAALCGPCNLKKGADMPKELRSHQEELRARAADVVTGRTKDRTTVANITPGGGKSLAGAVFARVLLEAGIVDRVCWVTPRTSLRSQAAEGFRDTDHNPRYLARAADNTTPLVRDLELGCVAYVTTYQAVASSPKIHTDEFDLRRYLLILDEPHHLADEEGKSWTTAIQGLMSRAAHVLMMTGTIERHDRLRIPFLEYLERDGRHFPVTHIEYGRRKALAERAVLEMKFTYQDGWAHFLDAGDERRIEISKASDDDASKVIATFLARTDYREALLRRGLDHWVAYASKVYPSRAIVICARQDMAKELCEFVRREYHVQVALAISDDLDSQRTIKQFRRGKRGQVLVTVGMAYEGLDVPDCTHLIFLHNTRSVPWIEQAFARVTRVDHKAVVGGVGYERQFGFIFVPDDPRMRAVVERMRAEQAEGLAARDDAERRTSEPAARQERMFGALGADVGPVGFGTIDGRMAPDDAARINDLLERKPSLRHVPPDDLLWAVQQMRADAAPSANQQSARPQLSEAEWRQRVQVAASSRDRICRLSPGTTNGMVRRHFGKSREQMGVAELERVFDWIVALDQAEEAS
jgi:superfamily II DNA or RNA helicase